MTYQAKRALLAIVGISVLLGLGACATGASKPTTLPPVHTPSPSASPSPTGSAALTAAGAEAFVREYFAAYEASKREGNISKPASMVMHSCQVCWDDLVRVRKYNNATTHTEGATYDLVRVAGHPPVENLTTVDITFDLPAARLVSNATGKTLESENPRPRTSAVLSLAFGDGGWHIVAFTGLPS